MHNSGDWRLIIGDRVKIAFNKTPQEEIERLRSARSGRQNTPSRVDQRCHQSVAQTGTILDKLSNNECLVNVDVSGSRGRKRIIKEDKLTLLS